MSTTLDNISRYVRQGPHFRELNRQKNPSPQLSVRFSPTTLTEIKRRASKSQMSAAKIVRQLVIEALARS